jgi:hypothetical protein
MLFVAATDLSASDLALLGNNLLPSRRALRRNPDERANRRVLSAVNRSLASLHERVDRLQPTVKSTPASRRLAS